MLLGIYFEQKPSSFVENQQIEWELCNELETEDEFHNFVIQCFTKSSYQGFVIYFELPKFEEIVLRLSGHLRLTNSNIKPIYIFGKSSNDDISKNDYANVLNLVGVSYKDVSADEPEIEPKPTITIDELKTQLKKGLSIPKPKKEGNHSIANEWGAFKLAYATNTLHLLEKNENVQAKRKTLYFKYLCLKENIQFPSATPTPLTIDCQNKKVLLIDDQADKGWEDIFKAILKNCHFEISPISYQDNSREKNEDKIFTDAENKINSQNWDIVLLDLRLKSSDRTDTASFNDIKQFSGYKLLQQIKAKNKGIQVIIFTASNKAWNMKYLVEAGADGYYIKESPDFQYEENYAQENFDAFKKDMERAVEKADFLKWFWGHTQDLKAHIKEEYENITDSDNTPNYAQGFITSVELSLDYAYDTIANYHSEIEKDEQGVDKIDANGKPILKYQKYLNYAFVGYCSLIEICLNTFMEVIPSATAGKKDFKLKAINTTKTQKDIILSNSKYRSVLEYVAEDKLINPPTISSMPYFKVGIMNDINFSKYQSQFGLSPLCIFSALLLLRYSSSGFTTNDIQKYEFLKRKRNIDTHGSSFKITIDDCEAIFRMVYIVLKGVDITP